MTKLKIEHFLFDIVLPLFRYLLNNKKLGDMKDEELTIFRRRNIGFVAIALAIATRCCCPPDRLFGIFVNF